MVYICFFLLQKYRLEKNTRPPYAIRIVMKRNVVLYTFFARFPCNKRITLFVRRYSYAHRLRTRGDYVLFHIRHLVTTVGIIRYTSRIRAFKCVHGHLPITHNVNKKLQGFTVSAWNVKAIVVGVTARRARAPVETRLSEEFRKKKTVV